MGLIEQAKKDAQRIISDLSGFGQSIEFIAPTGEIVTVTGLHKKIRLGVDLQTGNIINSLVATVTVTSLDLFAAGYPYRNIDGHGEVNLEGHLVNVKDVTGDIINYSIQSWHPDETVGLIVCYLQYFE